MSENKKSLFGKLMGGLLLGGGLIAISTSVATMQLRSMRKQYQANMDNLKQIISQEKRNYTILENKLQKSKEIKESYLVEILANRIKALPKDENGKYIMSIEKQKEFCEMAKQINFDSNFSKGDYYFLDIADAINENIKFYMTPVIKIDNSEYKLLEDVDLTEPFKKFCDKYRYSPGIDYSQKATKIFSALFKKEPTLYELVDKAQTEMRNYFWYNGDDAKERKQQHFYRTQEIGPMTGFFEMLGKEQLSLQQIKNRDIKVTLNPSDDFNNPFSFLDDEDYKNGELADIIIAPVFKGDIKFDYE